MEKVDLREVRHAERQRWRNGGEWDERATKIAVGMLPDGRWYVRMYGPYWPADELTGRVYPSEHLARRVARGWMRIEGGAWVDAVNGEPVELARPRALIGEWA